MTSSKVCLPSAGQQVPQRLDAQSYLRDLGFCAVDGILTWPFNTLDALHDTTLPSSGVKIGVCAFTDRAAAVTGVLLSTIRSP